MTSIDLLNATNNTAGPYKEAKGDIYGNMCTTYPIDGLPTQKFLTTTGISSFINLNSDFSAAPVDHYYKATNLYEVHTVLVSVSDGTKFNQVDFGGITDGLNKGINFWIGTSLTDKIPLFNDLHFKQNKDWFYITNDALLTDFNGIAQTQSILICISRCYGKPLIVEKDSVFGVTLHDDFSDLTAFSIQARGILY